MRKVWMLMGFAACGDRDFDGFTGRSDCDDKNAAVYEGAPELPRDGIDADCDGEDGEVPWLGAWNLVDLQAGYGGTQVLLPGTTSGDLTIGEDLTVQARIQSTLDPVVVGSAFPLSLALAGEASWAPGAASLDVYASGANYGEEMHIDWGCEVDPADAEILSCRGEWKAIEASLEANALLRR